MEPKINKATLRKVSIGMILGRQFFRGLTCARQRQLLE